MRASIRRQRGFTLVELMVAVTLGLLVVAGMTTLFVSNNNAQSEIEKANRQVENGRYAMQLISGDLRNAGFFGEFDPSALTGASAPAAPANPCDTALASIKGSVAFHVQGYDNAANGVLSCLDDVKSGTDVLVVRHASTCIVGAAGCDPASAGGPFFQASLCDSATELSSPDTNDFYAVDSVAVGGLLNRRKRDCANTAVVRRLEIHIYYVSNNNAAGDGMPTLKRAELINAGAGFQIVPLVEGIENMQLEYGIDSNNDGVADGYSTNPPQFNGCAGVAGCAVNNWRGTVTARVNLLARNTETSPNWVDKKSYTLGALSDGTPNVVQAKYDAYKRHVFQALVYLANPAGRRTP